MVSRNGGADVRIGPGVETVDRSLDVGDVLRLRAFAVEHERRRQILAGCGEAERLVAAPRKAHHANLPVAGGKLHGVVGQRVEIRGDLVERQPARRAYVLSIGRLGRLPFLGSPPRQHIGSEGQIARLREPVGDVFHPGGKAITSWMRTTAGDLPCDCG